MSDTSTIPIPEPLALPPTSAEVGLRRQWAADSLLQRAFEHWPAWGRPSSNCRTSRGHRAPDEADLRTLACARQHARITTASENLSLRDLELDAGLIECVSAHWRSPRGRGRRTGATS